MTESGVVSRPNGAPILAARNLRILNGCAGLRGRRMPQLLRNKFYEIFADSVLFLTRSP